MPLSSKMLLQIVVAVTFIVYSAICLFLFVKQHKFIFFPSSVIERTPAFFDLLYEDVWLPVISNGQRKLIHGWWIPSPQANADVLLYLHGNAINVGANVGHANRLHQLGFSILLIDYRGYGRSEGDFPNEKQVYEDTSVAWNYLVEERKILPSQIFIYGHSMGGAIAIDLALKQPEAAGLIVESSFTSIRDMVAYRNLFRIFPVNLILTQRFESLQKVPQLKLPVLFIHGTADTTVPSFMSQKLYHAAPEPKKLFLVTAADHNNTATVAGEDYLQWIKSFVELVKTRRFASTN